MPVPHIMEDIIKAISGCGVVTSEEVPQFEFSLVKVVDVPDVQIVGLCAPVVEQIVVRQPTDHGGCRGEARRGADRGVPSHRSWRFSWSSGTSY